jgi:HPt (histidine-containing phosphotransfer) domain-containing protein
MLRQLQRPDGPDRVGQIIQRFLEETEQRLVTLRAAVHDDDARSLEQAAHALKGIAGTVGANELHDIARRLEELGRAGTTLGAGPLLTDLEGAVQRATPVFEELLASA